MVLVVGYDQRMAVTLTVAGLLPVGIRDRHAQRQIAGTGRTVWLANRWIAVGTMTTAMLVLLVGVGLAVRSSGSL